MGLVYIERRTISPGSSLSWDIAHHLSTRSLKGVAIVTEQPAHLLASLRKQWIKVVYQLQREYSAMLTPERKLLLKNKIANMQALHFQIGSDGTSEIGAVLLLLEPEVTITFPNKVFSTMYITCHVTEALQQQIAERAQRHGLCVVYEI
jgi:hypothetical protein